MAVKEPLLPCTTAKANEQDQFSQQEMLGSTVLIKHSVLQLSFEHIP